MLQVGLTTTIVYRVFSVIKMASAIIEKITESDVSSLAKIDEVVFGGTFKESDFLGYIDSTIYRFFVAKIDENTVGYIGYTVIVDEAEIINVGVMPEYRGQKIGNALMDIMIEDLKKNGVSCVHLEVRKSNFVAISMYEKYGFIAISVSKNHYTNPTEDAIRMTKSF